MRIFQGASGVTIQQAEFQEVNGNVYNTKTVTHDQNSNSHNTNSNNTHKSHNVYLNSGDFNPGFQQPYTPSPSQGGTPFNHQMSNQYPQHQSQSSSGQSHNFNGSNQGQYGAQPNYNSQVQSPQQDWNQNQQHLPNFQQPQQHTFQQHQQGYQQRDFQQPRQNFQQPQQQGSQQQQQQRRQHNFQQPQQGYPSQFGQQDHASTMSIPQPQQYNSPQPNPPFQQTQGFHSNSPASLTHSSSINSAYGNTPALMSPYQQPNTHYIAPSLSRQSTASTQSNNNPAPSPMSQVASSRSSSSQDEEIPPRQPGFLGFGGNR
ncbi:hypothetical protein AMATHDRAFT_6686 [Amanita thiersii Skay4041]|uniref:Uncharacterized protein n=1 Tax=Amanita thiersii Skay4041 TaxID=703135 RepID=A0A2A9NIC1_9AGAR|nr:hypothetical protein AMATHDRAFT_6686 [Amanita thiersii Skay4041]